MSIDDLLPPFVRDYPIGAGIMIGVLLYGALALTAGADPGLATTALLVGMWIGWQFRHRGGPPPEQTGEPA